MRLSDLLTGVDFQYQQGSDDVNISMLHYDSRKILPGGLFLCLPGQLTDGHVFIEQAVKNGAVAVVVERDVLVPLGITCVKTTNARKTMARIAANFYDHPSTQLRVVGITGTNGKTTVSHLIQIILEEYGAKTGILGTLYARIDKWQKEYGHTTPESVEVQEFLDMVRQMSGQWAIMEVSSHALEQFRVEEIDFNVAVFTNLTQDHLDYHGTMEEYARAKSKLFSMIPAVPGYFCIINGDDPSCSLFTSVCSASYYTYGINNEADVRAVDLDTSLKGTRFMVKTAHKSFPIEMSLIGTFSVYNALAAIAFALAQEIPVEVIQKALHKVRGVPGRFEQVETGGDFTVIVDYAHTPDGLENILKTSRELAENRLIVVFGCGGDRDRSKRPLMGGIAGKYSDYCIVTSDNPRNEDPQKIISDIIPGLETVPGSQYVVIPDRREAIRHAIQMACPHDLVIIAGKGHENYQLIKGEKLKFDDRQVAREMLKEKSNHAI